MVYDAYDTNEWFTNLNKIENEIDIEISGLDAGTIARVKDDRTLREKIKQTIQLLFSVELYEDILDENEQQEEELKRAIKAKLSDVSEALRQNAPRQAHGQA